MFTKFQSHFLDNLHKLIFHKLCLRFFWSLPSSTIQNPSLNNSCHPWEVQFRKSRRPQIRTETMNKKL